MEEAGLEVGVEIGSPSIAAMLCLFPKVLKPGEWQGREAVGVLIVAGASCPHGVIIYWAGGPLKGLLAWCVAFKPSSTEVEPTFSAGTLHFGHRVFLWGADPETPEGIAERFKLYLGKNAIKNQRQLGMLLIHLHNQGSIWDGFLALSKKEVGSMVRGVDGAFDESADIRVRKWHLDGPNGLGLLARPVATQPGQQYRACLAYSGTLALYLERCPSPPERVNVSWQRSEFGSDTFGLKGEVSDCSQGSIYLCVARYPIVNGAPAIPPPHALRDRFERFRTHHGGHDVVSFIPGRGNRLQRLAYYVGRAAALGVQPHCLLWHMEFPKEELPFWEKRLIDFLGEGGGLERKAWFGVGGDLSAPVGMNLESFFGRAGDDPDKLLRFLGREKQSFEQQFLDRSIHAFQIRIPP